MQSTAHPSANPGHDEHARLGAALAAIVLRSAMHAHLPDRGDRLAGRFAGKPGSRAPRHRDRIVHKLPLYNF